MTLYRFPARVEEHPGKRVFVLGPGRFYHGSTGGPPLEAGAMYACVERNRTAHEQFERRGDRRQVESMNVPAQLVQMPSAFFHEMVFHNVFNEINGGMYQFGWLENNLDALAPGGRILIGNTHTFQMTWKEEIAARMAAKGFRHRALAYWSPRRRTLSPQMQERFVRLMGTGVLEQIKPGAVLLEFTRQRDGRREDRHA